MTKDQKRVSWQISSEAANPELIGLLRKYRNEVILLGMVSYNKVHTEPILHLHEINHLPWVVVEYA